MKPTFIIATGLLVLGVSSLALIATVASPVPVAAAQAASSDKTTTFDGHHIIFSQCGGGGHRLHGGVPSVISDRVELGDALIRIGH